MPLASTAQSPPNTVRCFAFYKGGENVLAGGSEDGFDWNQATAKVREHLADAMNSRHLAFLLGSGCSSYIADSVEHGIPTMPSLAKAFLEKRSGPACELAPSDDEVVALLEVLGLGIGADEYSKNLERLMEVLFSAQFFLERSSNEPLKECIKPIESLIRKVSKFICDKCQKGTSGDDSVIGFYQAFYRRLIYRDRTLPRPWVFTTNFDLFNETALDRIGIPYCNGFSGTVERRFNPSSYRYALAEQLDVSGRKWTSVDGYIYLCKLHGSINWIEDGAGLFPIRELSGSVPDEAARVMIYPTPTKQNASFGSPYSDLFREFQARVVREQSVLVVLGYGFGDEHINNLIFQALTVPTFRMIAFVNPDAGGVVSKLRRLCDPRVWLIGSDGEMPGLTAHYFNTFVERFMPEPPGNTVDTAVKLVLTSLLGRRTEKSEADTADEE